ncbi:MAG: PilZ domain-containing protein [Planctomycetota bacterium]|nr:PilZ domain-containing protein [Planctomycetota bacterium]
MDNSALAADTQPIDDPETQSTQNRRKWARYAMEPEDVVLTVGRRKRHAVIVDESIGGLGIKLANIKKLNPGEQVTLCFRGLDITAEIKSIRQDEDELYHVGIGWLDTGVTLGPAAPPPRLDRAKYICHKGVWLACDLLEQTKDGIATIVLWDNSYFEVSAERLRERTVEQRHEELQSLGNDVNLLAALYRLGDHGTAEKTCEAILDFEFAINWIG